MSVPESEKESRLRNFPRRAQTYQPEKKAPHSLNTEAVRRSSRLAGSAYLRAS